MSKTGLVGTLNAGYYCVDGGKQCQIRLWGSAGWFHLELDGRPRPLRWQSSHPDAPRGEQEFEWDDKVGAIARRLGSLLQIHLRQSSNARYLTRRVSSC
jgi:hypothetical protein